MSIVIEAALIGVLVGIVIGSLGGGGGIVAVPVLVYLLDQSPHDAAASSLVVVGTSSLVSLVPHARRGNVEWRTGALFAVASIAGNLAGARLSVRVDGDVLMACFAVLLAVVAFVMARRAAAGLRGSRGLRGGRRSGRGAATDSGAADSATPGSDAAGTATPDPASSGRTSSTRAPADRPWTARRVVVLLVTATGVGALTGFFGVGGGFAVVPALLVALHLPMRAAVGTSLLVLTISSAVGLVGRIGTDVQPDWALTAAFAATSILGALSGARLTRDTRPELLTAAFAALLAVVAVVTAAMALPALLG